MKNHKVTIFIIQLRLWIGIVILILVIFDQTKNYIKKYMKIF